METIIERKGVRRALYWSWRKYTAVLRVSVANNLAYIYEVLFRSLFLIVLIFVFGQLWKTTYSARGVSLLGGFSMNAMIWYLAAAETIATSMPPLTRRIDEDVRSGRLAYLLGRPNSYVFYNFAQYLGERLVRFCLNGVVASVVALLIVGPPHFTWIGVLAWPFVTFLALCIDFAAYFAIGLLAFWTEDTNSFTIIYSRLTLVLGGVLVPLEVFPQPLRGFAQVLPFSAILYGPARTLVLFDPVAFGGLLVQQAITLGAACLVVGAIYRVAIRRVNINGG
jgi:ABC-2 type transport system permease protein